MKKVKKIRNRQFEHLLKEQKFTDRLLRKDLNRLNKIAHLAHILFTSILK